MSRMPCSITDGPQYDDDDFKTPIYERDPDDAYDEWRSTQIRNPKTGNLEPLITPHVGDKNENH